MAKKPTPPKKGWATRRPFNSVDNERPTQAARASIFDSDKPLPPSFVEAIKALEAELGLPVWFIVQDSREEWSDADSFNMLGNFVSSAFFAARRSCLPAGKKIALLIDSHGGMARQAYEIAMLLRRHCGGFTAVIPRHAKSAATLLTLGADEIIMGRHAELGPLDVQIRDPDREAWLSGLDEVKSLAQLLTFAIDAVDQTMWMLLSRTKKKVNTLFPVINEFVTHLTQPMFASIDVVRYTQMARLLRVAQTYGTRLLEKRYPETAVEIARRLVEDYPEHAYPIYQDEVIKLGLKITAVSPKLEGILEALACELPNLNVVGSII